MKVFGFDQQNILKAIVFYLGRSGACLCFPMFFLTNWSTPFKCGPFIGHAMYFGSVNTPITIAAHNGDMDKVGPQLSVAVDARHKYDRSFIDIKPIYTGSLRPTT